MRGEEQRSLKISQFKREEDSYVYVENGSKNCSGTSTRIANKVVPVYSRPESIPRCLVHLLDTYLKKLPAWAKEKDIFYCRPVKTLGQSGVWYECAAVGKEKLRTYLASMCEEAGISKGKTNHSLRATGTTAMFAVNVPEKIIRSVTGHRSTVLQLYERPTEEQQKSVSDLLLGGKQMSTMPVPQQHQSTLHQPSGTTAIQRQQCVKRQQSRTPLDQIQPAAAAPIFSGLTGCTISNFVVNVHQAPSTEYEEYEEEFDELVMFRAILLCCFANFIDYVVFIIAPVS